MISSHVNENSLAYSPPCSAASVLQYDLPLGGIVVGTIVARWAGVVLPAPGSKTLLNLSAVTFATPGKCSTIAGSKQAEL